MEIVNAGLCKIRKTYEVRLIALNCSEIEVMTFAFNH